MFRFPGLPEELNIQIDKHRRDYEEEIEKKISQILFESSRKTLYMAYTVNDEIIAKGLFFMIKEDRDKLRNFYKNKHPDLDDQITIEISSDESGHFFNIAISPIFADDLLLRRGYAQELINILRETAITYDAIVLDQILAESF